MQQIQLVYICTHGPLAKLESGQEATFFRPRACHDLMTVLQITIRRFKLLTVPLRQCLVSKTCPDHMLSLPAL